MEIQKQVIKKEILLIGLLFIIVGLGIFLFLPKKSSENNPEPTPPQAVVTPTTEAKQPGTYAIEEIRTHTNAESCWSVINGNVYDLTSAVDKHKSGPEDILKMCGKDATADFEKKHGGEDKPESWLKTLKIGSLQK